jgi:hypothetical protein
MQIKKIILVSISVLVIATCISAIVLKNSKPTQNSTIAAKARKPTRSTKNDWLKQDFEKITAFYNSGTIRFKIRYSYFTKGGDVPTNESEASVWLKDGNYLMQTNTNEVMRNNQLSIMVDKQSHIIIIDTAWDANTFMPGGINMDTLMGLYDSIQRMEINTEYKYLIPARGLGMSYSELFVEKQNYKIRKIAMYTLPEPSDSIASDKPARLEITFVNLDKNDFNSANLFNTENYLKTGLPKPVANSVFSKYQIITKNTQ